jgi:hypothetical protein
MSRKKVILLSLVVVCVIGTITALVVNQREEPRNVFEEMYYAEMDAAEMNSKLAEGQTKQKTPLSNTEYFDETIAAIDYDGGESTSSIVREVPKEDSRYDLLALYFTIMGEKSPMGRGPDEVKKIVRIENWFWYQDVKIEIEYHYVLFNGRGFKRYFDKEGLSISVGSVINGRNVYGYQDLSSYGIQEDELRKQVEENLTNMLNYWVDNYPQSKFNGDDFGMYEIVKPS